MRWMPKKNSSFTGPSPSKRDFQPPAAILLPVCRTRPPPDPAAYDFKHNSNRKMGVWGGGRDGGSLRMWG